MKNKSLKIIMGCFLASHFFACSANDKKEQKESCTTTTSAINPNGDSELALLMRRLRLNTDSLKQLIANKEGNISDAYIAELERAHSAIPTDPNVKTPEFTAFNDLIITQAKALQNASIENRTKEFNQLINSCVNCHLRFCPGPIEAIQKLNIVNPI